MKNKNLKYEKMRRTILAAALRMFKEKGYEATTMRDIAKAAGLAVGSTYYYFVSKEAMVLSYYEDLQKESELECQKICEQNKDFETRVRLFLNHKIDQLKNSGNFLKVLVQAAGNPDSVISPFGSSTEQVRKQAIKVFTELMQDVRVVISQEFLPLLPNILWSYQMGIILFWIYDNSQEYQKTSFFMNKTLSLIFTLFYLSRFPLLGSFKKTILEIFNSALSEEQIV